MVNAVGLDPSCRQLDRKSHTVKLSADANHDCRFRIAEFQAGATCNRALDEQLRRGESLCDRSRKAEFLRRKSKGIQSIDVLSFDLERLAAGRQDVDLGRGHKDGRCQRRHCFNQMLAGIEDQKNALVPEICGQAWGYVIGLDGKSKHGGYGCGHQAWIAQHTEIDKEHGACKGLDELMSNGYRNCGLTNSAGAGDRDKAGRVQPNRHLENVIVAADHLD